MTFSINFFPPPPLRGQETTTSLDLIPAQVVQSEKMGKSRNGSTGEQMQLEITKGKIKLFEKNMKRLKMKIFIGRILMTKKKSIQTKKESHNN